MNLDAVFAVVAGVAVVAYALQTAIRTFLLPQPGQSLLSRVVFWALRPVVLALDRLPSAAGRRHGWAHAYVPLCLVTVVFATMAVISVGYAAILYGLGAPTPKDAFLVSISSVSTLGFAPLGDGLAVPLVATIETMTSILVVAVLIGYLPGIYAAVQQRERGVAALEAHVGSPVSAGSILGQFAHPDGERDLDAFWKEWSEWFSALGHSHDSMAELLFVRSPRPGRSWVTTAGAVLAAAALTASAATGSPGRRAGRCFDAGRDAICQIAGNAGHLPGLPDVRWAPATAVSRIEFDAAWSALSAAGLDMAADQDGAWLAFGERQQSCALALQRLERAAGIGLRRGAAGAAHAP